LGAFIAFIKGRKKGPSEKSRPKISHLDYFDIVRLTAELTENIEDRGLAD